MGIRFPNPKSTKIFKNVLNNIKECKFRYLLNCKIYEKKIKKQICINEKHDYKSLVRQWI